MSKNRRPGPLGLAPRPQPHLHSPMIARSRCALSSTLSRSLTNCRAVDAWRDSVPCRAPPLALRLHTSRRTRAAQRPPAAPYCQYAYPRADHEFDSSSAKAPRNSKSPKTQEPATQQDATQYICLVLSGRDVDRRAVDPSSIVNPSGCE